MNGKIIFKVGCLFTAAFLLAGCEKGTGNDTRGMAQRKSEVMSSSVGDMGSLDSGNSGGGENKLSGNNEFAENEAPGGQGKSDGTLGGAAGLPLAFEADPETFALSVSRNGVTVPVSGPAEKRSVEGFSEAPDQTGARWRYPEAQVEVSLESRQDYLHVTITSQMEGDNRFEWPVVSGETYYIPFGEGKRIPAEDSAWIEYLDGNVFNTMEQLSMPFWIAAQGESAVLVIMENPYRNDMEFQTDPRIRFALTHHYPEIDPVKDNSFRIYLLDNDPAEAAKLYKQYVKETGEFVTLEEKAGRNPNIRKLYGAPHIYLWGDRLIEPANVNWPQFRTALGGDVMGRLIGFAPRYENGQEVLEVLRQAGNQDYVDNYQKNVICGFMSQVLREKDFYDPQVFPQGCETVQAYLQKGIAKLNPSEWMQLNKHVLAENLPEVFSPAKEWMDSDTTKLLEELKDAGIDRAWIGLNDWEQAYAKPELAETAKKLGYLIAPYDSYHSIHEPGKEQWPTAAFSDASLYENASVTDKNGEKLKGFQNVGRKLNPTLSMDAVVWRLKEILSTGIPFNSWFIDCDATGEIYDDYSPSHITTQQEDLKARLERMSHIREEKNMVIGSEGGNDFAAPVIAFAHGIELKTFSWMDEDMKKNRESEYYIGKYYSPTGGVAEHFSKRIPVKEQYYQVFVDPRYDAPLFRLVYNDSVITTYHWDWSTFKIKGAVADRMLREILYNTPPLYHLDREQWERYKEDLTAHTKVWSEFAKQAVVREMTDFQLLKEDGTVQRTEYGEGLAVVANFNGQAYDFEGQKIPPHSLLIWMNGTYSVYTPVLGEENR